MLASAQSENLKGSPMKNITKQLLVWLLAVLMVWPWPVRLDAQEYWRRVQARGNRAVSRAHSAVS